MSAVELRVAVVGGGIGGLTLAVAPRRLGVEVEVLEQSSELTEIVSYRSGSGANTTSMAEPRRHDSPTYVLARSRGANREGQHDRRAEPSAAFARVPRTYVP